MDAAVTSHDYMRSLFQNARTITKVLSNALEDRMTDVSLRADKMDPTIQSDHIGRIKRVYQEANISGTVGTMLQTLAVTHGTSPIYSSFSGGVREAFKKKTGNSLFFYQTGGGRGYPPSVENQTSKGFPVFSKKKTGN